MWTAVLQPGQMMVIEVLYRQTDAFTAQSQISLYPASKPILESFNSQRKRSLRIS